MGGRKVILGIDTGGTFTDGIILDVETDTVIGKAKSTTTREDLSIGIGSCIRELKAFGKGYEVKLVCISTTLATNSVVEGRRARVGLIAIDKENIVGEQRVEVHRKVSGRLGITGNIEEELNENEAVRAIEAMKGKVESLVVSGYLSVRNPVQELRVREMASEILDVPVICAHELSLQLGFKERTDTAVLNAHLLPVIEDMIKKIRESLKDSGIDAEIAIMKGDGTMMQEAQALRYPVETVLSGPSASVVGGSFLTDIKDAYFVDLGGTTMDIADMKDGRVTITEEGATVGGWKTKVVAADIYTYGLGGDSRLTIDGNGEYSFGPIKAIPLCFACERYPHLIDEMENNVDVHGRSAGGFRFFEGLMLAGKYDEILEHNTDNKSILKLLKDGPRSVAYIASRLSATERLIGVRELLHKGIISVISLTPTDLLHAKGEFSQWNTDAADRALDIIVNVTNETRDVANTPLLTKTVLLDSLIKTFTDQITFAMIKTAFAFEDRYNKAAMEYGWLYDALFSKADSTLLKCVLTKPIIAIGAPAGGWLKRLGPVLGTDVIIPENYEVANAVGAAKGIISETFDILIRYNLKEELYNIYSQWGMHMESDFEQSKEYAQNLLNEKAGILKSEMKLQNPKVVLNERTKYFKSNSGIRFKDAQQVVYECSLSLVISDSPGCFS